MEAATSVQPEQKEMPIDRPKGRKDKNGQEMVIKEKPLKAGIADLMALKAKRDIASEKFNKSVKEIAEQSGLLSSVVRKLVNAKCGDHFDDKRRELEQLQIAFDACPNAD